MEFRNLGNSGLRISEIAYGNWLTHGPQVERDTAMACVRQALDVGITTFDTADQEVIPISEKLGIGQIVWSPIAQGVLTGKYQSGQAPPARSRATDELGGASMISHWLKGPVLAAVQQLRPLADAAGLSRPR